MTEIIQTVLLPVICGIMFLFWSYALISPGPPSVVVFPLVIIPALILYQLSGPVFCGVFLFFVTIAGFLCTFLAPTLKAGVLFFLETLWAWGMFFSLERFRYDREQRKNRLSEEREIREKEIAALEHKIEISRKRSIDLTQRVGSYQQLGNVIELIGFTLHEDKLVPLIRELASRFIGKGSWTVKKGVRDDPFAQYIRTQQVPLIVGNIASDNRFYVGTPHFASMIAVPLAINGTFWGILRGTDLEPNRFDESDLRLLSVLGGIASLVLNNARLYRRTQELAITDGLTGLYVQSYFKERLEEEVHRSRSNRLALSVALIDIDHFKSLNDSFGHAAGDTVLRSISSLLRRRLRETDFLCRYGGEEFGIIMMQTGLREAVRVIEQIRESIAEERFFLPMESFQPVQTRLTVSAGIAAFSEKVREESALLRAADEALYRAKKNGRNRVETDE